PALAPESLIEMLCEESTVGQSGELVVEGLVAELVFECLLIRDVSAVEYQPADAGLVDKVGDDGLEEAPRAIGMTDLPLRNHFAVGVLGQEIDNGEPTWLIRVMKSGHKTGPIGAIHIPAKDSRNGWTLKQDDPVSVDDGDKV